MAVESFSQARPSPSNLAAAACLAAVAEAAKMTMASAPWTMVWPDLFRSRVTR
ncbi:hypothetical protein [Pseudomonas phage BILI]